MGRGWGVPAPGQDLEVWPSSSGLGQAVTLGDSVAALVGAYASAPTGTSYASWSTPDSTVGNNGGTSGNTGGDYSSPQDAAETAAENDWLWGLGDAVEAGNVEGYVNDHLEYEQVWCELFEVPSGGECPTPYTTSCDPPCVHPSAVCSVEDLPWWEAVGRYEFGDVIDQPALIGPQRDAFDVPVELLTVDPMAGVTPWSVTDIDRLAVVLQYAWAVLLDNLDLIEWIVCLYYGEDIPADDGQLFDSRNTTVAECVNSRILGDPPKLTFRFIDWIGITGGVMSGGDPQGWSGLPGGQIVLSKLVLSKYVEPFEQAAGDDAARFCVVADFAGSLLHELIHTCPGAEPLDNNCPDVVLPRTPEVNCCSTSYLIENAFRSALGVRYPCLANTAGCAYYTFQGLWGNDGAAYVGAPPDGVVP